MDGQEDRRVGSPALVGGGAMNLQLGAGLVWAWMLSFAVWGGIRGRVQNFPM
jgi:hypothetical protein